MVSYTNEVLLACFYIVYLQKKDDKYLEKFMKGIVAITLQPGLWWQKLSDTDFSGLPL